MIESSSRAKSSIGWGAAFLVVSCLGLVAAMETRCPELCDPEYGLRLKRLRKELAHQPPGRVLVCALGSSRVATGLRPDRMFASRPESADQAIVFNFGVASGGPLMELCYLRRLLDDGVRPDWVLAEVWPPYLYHGEDFWAEEKRMDLMRLQWDDLAVFSRTCARPRSVYKRWCKGQILPWYSHRNFLLSLWAPAWVPEDGRLDAAWQRLDSWGWLSQPWGELAPEVRQQLFEHGRQILAPALDQFQVGNFTDRALRDLIALCRREKIGIALIFLPESEQCRNWYPQAARTQVDQYLRRLSQECDVPIINARPWIQDSEFLDGYHLTIRGAASFSEQLQRRVLQPLLTGSPLASRDIWGGVPH